MNLVLNKIADRLQALEETILYKLIDRVQYKLNSDVYVAGTHYFEEFKEKSLLEVRMKYQQDMESVFGRFSVPEERPFVGDLLKPQREFPYAHDGLHIDDFNKVNVTADIWQSYLELVTDICEDGDDGHQGSTVVCDVNAMMAISERVHYGAFYVAEAKYQADPKKYDQLIKKGEPEDLIEALTRPEIEGQILERIRKKAERLQEGVDINLRGVLDPEMAAIYYEEWIIPLTKKGQVIYLLNRSQ